MEKFENAPSGESVEIMSTQREFVEQYMLLDRFSFLAWATEDEIKDRLSKDKDFEIFLKQHDEYDDAQQAEQGQEQKTLEVANKLLSSAKKLVPENLWRKYEYVCGTHTVEINMHIMSGVSKSIYEILFGIDWDEFIADPKQYLEKCIKELE